MSAFELVEKWIAKDKFRLKCLIIAKKCVEHEWYLSAGFARNLVWDKLQGHKEMTPLNDIDLVYFNSFYVSNEQDKIIEIALNRAMPACNWSVKIRAIVSMTEEPYAEKL